MKLPCAVVLLFLSLMASVKGQQSYGFEDPQEFSYQSYGYEQQVEAISAPTCAPSERGLSSEEQEITIRLERGDITVEELLERIASKPIIPKLRCEDGPQKLIHSIPGEFHWPPIMKGSCDNLPGCRVPPCFPQRTVRRSVCVLVFRFINGQWVKIGYQIRFFLDHLSCECKQCKHIRSQKECVNTYACPNSDNECTFCYWNNTLPIGKRQVPDVKIPFPFGRCDCCTPYCCPAPKRFNYDRCRCDCPNIIRCPTGQIFNHDTCKCECPRISCPPRQILNPKTCKCECARVIRCPPGQIFNKKTCMCECAQIIRCPPGQIFNPKTCRCECPKGSEMDDSGRCIGDCREIGPAFCTRVFCEENPRLRCRQIDFQCRCA